MPGSSASDLHGFLAIDKPAGWTSHDVVARVRKLTGVRRVGHAGTLDPFATGVLVNGVGKATRLIQYAQRGEKRYLAQVRLGVETDTLDVEGVVVAQADVVDWPNRDQVDAVLASFVGEIEQLPPAYSAIRVDGERAYRRARAGEHVEMPLRRVHIVSIELLAYEPPDLDIDVRCGAGTYLRSLARDIGNALGTLGYCHALRRTAVGPFTLERCYTLDELAEVDLPGRWDEFTEPPDAAGREFGAVTLDETQTEAWYYGRPVAELRSDSGASVLVRVYSFGGAFAGLGKLDPDHGLIPELVFVTG
jgi:tRNA pseudouridine55 synthase